MDEFDSNTTPMNESHDEQHVEGSSRRTFLKAAVVGSATAVAVSGVGAAAFTLTGHHTGLRKYLALTDTISGVTGNACTTDSSDNSKSSFHNDSIYFWAKFNGLPSGTYTIDVSPTIPDGDVDYQAGGSGNNVFIYTFAGGDSSFDCNPSSLPDTNTAVVKQHALFVTFTTSSDGDVLLELHLNPSTNSGSDILTATLYQGTGTGGAVVDTAQATISFT